MSLSGDIVLMEEGPICSARHVLKAVKSDFPTTTEVTQDNGSLRLRPQNNNHTSSALVVAVLHHAPDHIIKLEACVTGIVIYPEHLEGIPLTQAALRLLQVQPNEAIFLRPGDIVKFNANTTSEIRLRFGLQSMMDSAIQVNSSIAPDTDTSVGEHEKCPNSTFIGEHTYVTSHASVQISRSMSERAGTTTPIARKFQNIVQETPAIEKRHYNAFSHESTHDDHEVEGERHRYPEQMSKNITQVKSEETSQRDEDSIDSQPPVPSPGPQTLPDLREIITDSFQCGQVDTNSLLYPATMTDFEPSTAPERSSNESNSRSNVPYATAMQERSTHDVESSHQIAAMRTPTPTAQQLDNNRATENNSNDYVNQARVGNDLRNPAERVPVTRSNSQLSSNSSKCPSINHGNVDGGGGIKLEAVHHEDGGQESLEAASEELGEPDISNTSKDEATTSKEQGFVSTSAIHAPNNDAQNSDITSPPALNRKRTSSDTFEQILETPNTKRAKRSDTLENDEAEDTTSDSSSEGSSSGIIRPRPKVAVVIPPDSETGKPTRPSPANRAKTSRLVSAIRPATTPKRSSITPLKSSARMPTNPPSSMESRTSRRRASAAASTPSTASGSPKPYSGKAPRVVFSNSTIPQKPTIMKFFTVKGGKTIEHATGKYDVLVVGNGELKKTSKFLMSIALGKYVATDAWIAQSAKEGKFLDASDFIPSDPVREKAWGITLEDVIGMDRRQLFAGKTILLTTSLKKEYGNSYSEIEELAKTVGVIAVVKYTRDVQIGAETVVLARERDDLDAIALMNQGTVCYSKDLLSISILRGNLDLGSDEFKIVAPSSAEQTKKGKGRKSG